MIPKVEGVVHVDSKHKCCLKLHHYRINEDLHSLKITTVLLSIQIKNIVQNFMMDHC